MGTGLLLLALLAVCVPGSLQSQSPLDTPSLTEISEQLAQQVKHLTSDATLAPQLTHARKLLVAPATTGALSQEPVSLSASLGSSQARCSINILGNNQTESGIKSANILCSTEDGKDVFMFMGAALLAFRANFQGVQAEPASGGLDLDPNAVVLMHAGGLEIYDSNFDNIAVGKDFGLITVSEGTSPVVIRDSTFSRVTTCVGSHQAFADRQPSDMCLPVIAVSGPKAYLQIEQSNFIQNSCFDPDRCHSGTIFATDGASVKLNSVTINKSFGHFGGALMVTNGARFETSEAVITSSAVSTPESAGAAIWLGSCQSNADTSSRSSFANIAHSWIASNWVQGTGGGMIISDCPNTIVSDTIFANNGALRDGGAIVMRGSSSSLKVDSSFFVDNKQHELLGSAISQELCNPSQISASGNALWQSPETLKASTGCQPIQTGKSGNTVDSQWTPSWQARFNSIVSSIQSSSQ